MRDAEQHHRIHANHEEIVIEQVIEAAESCIEQAARRQHHEAPVHLRLAAPHNRKPKQRAERQHVEKRDAQKCRVSLMKLQRIEPPHHHRNHCPQRDHHGPESSAKPSQRPVHTHLPHAHQR